MSSSNVAVDDRILDAAARCLQLTGRAPIAEVARQSGVSRPTVYRRFADSDAVVRALWERELGRLVDATPRRGDDRAALVSQIVRIADRISTHETLISTFVSDRGLIAEYIVDRLGGGQRALLELLRGAIVDAQRAGTVRRGRPDELAAMVLLIAQSAIQSRQMIADYLSATAWRRELTRAIDGYLAP
ncbi:MAG: TetR/AcrR family transcriptional regulator [Actinobacteria bacterium]|nr:TetR/AcrR family transcriptional regulator [Actinomycetota bacterium]